MKQHYRWILFVLAAIQVSACSNAEKVDPNPAVAPAATPSVADGLELLPGKRLGKISLGMTREDLKKVFKDKLIVKKDLPETGEAFLKAGPYSVTLMDGKVDSAQINLFDAKQIKVNGKELRAGITLEEAAKVLSSCQIDLRRGATLYHCAGCGLSCPGNNIPETLEVSVSPMISNGLDLLPGKRLGKITLGMTREDLKKVFKDKLIVKKDLPKTGEAYLKAGPYSVTLMDGKVDSARINLFDAKQIKVNGKELQAGITIEQAAKLLSPCEIELRLGATLYKCTGCGLICPGTTTPESLEVSVSPMTP